jgi:hypothetical protein
MRALNRKLLRDLWHLRGQVVAVAMVVASGVAVLVMSLSTLEALQETTQAYYERYRFADVFAMVKRAPEPLAARIAAIPGVQTVETRISRYAVLDVAGFAEPVMGRLVSIPERGEPALNRLALRAGRLVAPDRPDEVVLNEPFAEAHGLGPGARLAAIMNGTKRTLEVVGIALSPEFVYAMVPGALMPDNRRFGIMWMGREALAAAYDLDGAFDDLALSLQRGVAPGPVIERVDHLLEPYGGIGAIARADQMSNWFLMNEMRQLKSLTTILPTIFLAVAAFLTNMVLGRLVATERSEIGLLKAFGYRNLEVGWQYAKFVLAMTAVGVVLGWLLGSWLGRINTEMYAMFFRFPIFVYRPGPMAFAVGAMVSTAAALAGSLRAVRGAVALPPAEAMRPPAPAMYRRGRAAAFTAWLDEPTRIIVRQVARFPLRAALTSIAVACSVALVVMALQFQDSMRHLIEVYFYDAAVTRGSARAGAHARRARGRADARGRREPARRRPHLSRLADRRAGRRRAAADLRRRRTLGAGPPRRRGAGDGAGREAGGRGRRQHLGGGPGRAPPGAAGAGGGRGRDLHRAAGLHASRRARPHAARAAERRAGESPGRRAADAGAVRRAQGGAGDLRRHPAAGRRHGVRGDHGRDHADLHRLLLHVRLRARLRRRVQQRAHRAVRARPRARHPARARLHAPGGVLHPAR